MYYVTYTSSVFQRLKVWSVLVMFTGNVLNSTYCLFIVSVKMLNYREFYFLIRKCIIYMRLVAGSEKSDRAWFKNIFRLEKIRSLLLYMRAEYDRNVVGVSCHY